jgi:LysM repeat protein
MMTIYTVQQGDWLSKIAIQKGLTVEQLLQANPRLRPNPDLILAGEELEIPLTQTQKRDLRLKQEQEQQPTSGPMSREQTPAKTDAAMTLPEPAFSGDKSTAQAQSEPLCQAKLYEVVYLTGDAHEGFYLLDAEGKNALHAELKVNEELMEKHRELCKGTPQAALETETPTDAERKAHGKAWQAHLDKKFDWLEKAGERGLIALTPPPKKSEDFSEKISELEQKIKALAKDRIEIEGYFPISFFDGSGYELNSSQAKANWVQLKKHLLVRIDEKRPRLQEELDHLEGRSGGDNAQGNSGLRYATDVRGDMHVASKKISSGRDVTRTKNAGVVEVLVFSKPGQWHYLSLPFVQQVKTTRSWVQVSSTRGINDAYNGYADGTADVLANKISNDIKKDMAEGNAEIKLWSTDNTNALNAWHNQLFSGFTSEGLDPEEVVFAASADAQAMRFSAAASVEFSGFSLDNGPITLGTKVDASFALAEGSIAATCSLPDEAGFHCSITYRDDQGDYQHHCFGAFRFQGGIQLSGFAGAKGTVAANAMLSPTVAVGQTPGGSLGLKADAFGGAEVGGKISGSVQWQLPAKTHAKTPAAEGATEDDGFGDLIQLKAEGNVAIGAGLGGEFKIEVEAGKFVIFIEGRVVFGPGASGAFGGVVDGGKIWDLAEVVYDVLRAVDYRQLGNIGEDAFIGLYQGLYQAFTEPGATLEAVFNDGYMGILDWYKWRQLNEAEAERLAGSIAKGAYDWQLLPPETLGMMLHTLTALNGDAQERAIIRLLENVTSWRHFIKALEHMSEGGESANPLDSLDRLNAILNGQQQVAFNGWVNQLRAENASPRSPFHFVPQQTKRQMVAQNQAHYRSVRQQGDTHIA